MPRLVLALAAIATLFMSHAAFADVFAADGGSTSSDAGAYDADAGSSDVDYDAYDVSEDGDASPACYYDADCGPCAACVGGQCEGLGVVACYNSGDCGSGMTCQVDPSAPCKNACVADVTACSTAADCRAALINLYRLDGSLLLRRHLDVPGAEPVAKKDGVME